MKKEERQLFLKALNQFLRKEDELSFLAGKIEQRLEALTFCRNQMILTEEEVAGSLYFVTRGLARHFYARNDKEHTVWFSWEGSFMANAGFFKQMPVNEQIQAIEPMRAYSITYQDFTEICNLFPALNDLTRMIFLENLFLLDAHFGKFHLLNAEERYGAFLDEYPGLIQRVPLLHVASFLGMTPETLSRIRTRILFS